MTDSFDEPVSELELTKVALAAANSLIDSLRVSELRYRRLFEEGRDGILILDSVEGKIIDANPFMTHILGYSHDELLGQELWQIGLLSDKAASQRAFRELRKNGYIRYEHLPLENRKGERVELEFVCNVYRENGHSVIQCNIRDITERRHLEEVLATIASKNDRIAEMLQRSMLMKPDDRDFPDLKVETLYQAAMDEADIGGDFFDVFALSGGIVALVVGDVTGKGLVAAMRSAEVKYALRAFLYSQKDPEVALGQLNDFICETHRAEGDAGETFIVLALVLINTDTGEATFTAAGAEPTLILLAAGGTEHVEVVGMPLGISTGETYSVMTRFLDHGDTVMIATDGITEARHATTFLGSGGMADLAERTGASAPLQDLSRAIYDGALDFAKGPLRDDVCLLLARWR